ncbi:MAG: ATP-binding cassette domain-containing protein, partial [Desulfovibrionaceae bacterium]
MTEILLNAILNLFALRAAGLAEAGREASRRRVGAYLTGHLRLADPEPYLDLYDTAASLHEDADQAMRRQRAAAVAEGLKARLPRVEQYVLVLRFLELSAAGDGDEPETEHETGHETGDAGGAGPALARTVAHALGIPHGGFEDLRRLADPVSGPRGAHVLWCNPPEGSGLEAAGPEADGAAVLRRPGFQGSFVVLAVPEADACFLAARGGRVSLDSLEVPPGSARLLRPGAIVRDGRGERIYSSEIAAALNRDPDSGHGLAFRGEHLEFRYPGSDNGLHDFGFCVHGGQLVGVMGGSGAGKSTLLGILSGQMRPDSGRVTVGGVDLHAEPHRLEGVIGYVPQDDLLFEDLTVFQNLDYAARLCLANLSDDERRARVRAVLDELGQLETADLKVGSPLEKTISGGQRKRLNIALELIREPPVLFVDEPTSGLSSADSENVMALLKAQAAKGRLVIAVIHQPSSQIFKMFDVLWVMDQGGRPIWDGNPLDAIVHFRTAIHQAGMEEYACPHCGSVNPEQLFEIIEAKATDESGRATRSRLVPAEQWHRMYVRERERAAAATGSAESAAPVEPKRRLWRPGRLGQLGVFFLRTLKGRLANRQYMGINVLEPPLLAALVALVAMGPPGAHYVFGENDNLGVFFFISVIVALFVGLSVSAEEINRDRKILRRERFLHLSWPSYVAAKTLYLALVSALQMAVYAVVANGLLDVPDFLPRTWFTLFSCAMVSCVLGLNISAAMRSAVTIYILIPLILVPQMMLGGAVVPLDELAPVDAGNARTPLVADLMPSRWGYEALVTAQYMDNAYMVPFFADDCAKRQTRYETDRRLPELRALADQPFLAPDGPDKAADTERGLRILAREVRELAAETGLDPAAAAELDPARITPRDFDRETMLRVKRYLKEAQVHFNAQGRAAAERLEAAKTARADALGGKAALDRLESAHHNRAITRLALNTNTLRDLRRSGDRVVQLAAPICHGPDSRLGRAHFFAPFKRLGAWTIPTPAFDLGVLWAMVALLYAALYGAWLPRLLALPGRLAARLRRGAGGGRHGGP